MDYTTLELLSRQHPAWQLLRAQHAPFVAAFLNRVFLEPNVRTLPEAHLIEALDDELFGLRERLGEDSFPRDARAYLNDWSRSERGWLRKFYPADSDEPRYDLTPATEQAIRWLSSLSERSFVGTESRLLTLIDLLRQLSHGTERDPEVRIDELRRQRQEIDDQIARIEEGDLSLLDSTAVKERYQQFRELASQLLADFREVEHNFRRLDRQAREKITLWDGGKGELLEEIMGDRDAITGSHQGRSFRAFWELLMSQSRQEELGELLDKMLRLPAVAEERPEPRLRRIHYDWLEAGDHTQRTVAQLSQQLRRFLDDKAWLENRRIMEILNSLEANALAVRDAQPPGPFAEIAAISPSVELPMERRLFAPPSSPAIASEPVEVGDAEIDASALFAHSEVDPAELALRIRRVLQARDQVTLGEIIDQYPLEHGLAELVTYLRLAGESDDSVVDEAGSETIAWLSADSIQRRARIPRVIFRSV
ncbi:MAG TPA: DUF3375 domain-containing protein [Trueperaceae bacterium]